MDYINCELWAGTLEYDTQEKSEIRIYIEEIFEQN